jgi:itaconate CoA-transferase
MRRERLRASREPSNLRMTPPTSSHRVPSSDAEGSCADLLVVAIEQAVAAPFASRQLADLGARVLKVERPDGGDFARAYDTAARGISSHFAWLNYGKESVVADLKNDNDRQFVEELVGRADVFIQNLAPGAAQRLGLDAGTLVGRYPRLVACDISGYGSGGPYENRKAYDLLIQCEAGLVATTGSPEAPAKAGIAVADIAAGMYAFSGVLAALYERERTGHGLAFEVSLFDALAEWMGYPALYGHYRGADPPRTGASHASIAPYGPFPTRDANEINIAIQNEREWRVFCTDILGRSELAEDPRFVTNAERVAHRAELEQLVTEHLAASTLDDLTRQLDAARIAFAMVRSAGELVDHPQLVERNRWTMVDSPVGELLALKPPVVIVNREPAAAAIPALGEHTDTVRQWLTATGSGGRPQ